MRLLPAMVAVLKIIVTPWGEHSRGGYYPLLRGHHPLDAVSEEGKTGAWVATSLEGPG